MDIVHTSEEVGSPREFPSSSLTPSEAAAELHVSANTVHRWLREGRLDAVRVGGRYRLERQALEQVITRTREAGE